MEISQPANFGDSEEQATKIDASSEGIRTDLQNLLQYWNFQFKTSLQYNNSIGFPNSHPLLSPTELRLVRILKSGPVDMAKEKKSLERVLEGITKQLNASFKHPIHPTYKIDVQGSEIIVSPSPTLVSSQMYDEVSGKLKTVTFAHEDAQMMLGVCRTEVDAIKLQEAIEDAANTFQRAGVKINPKNNQECIMDLKFNDGVQANAVKEARALAEAIAYGFGDVHIADCRQTGKNNVMVILNVGREWGTKALERYIPNVLKNVIPVESQAIASSR